jgi:hypothetical protein
MLVHPQSQLIREPRLLVPRGSPIGRVKIDWSHPLSRDLLAYAPLCEKLGMRFFDLVSNSQLTPRAGYEVGGYAAQADTHHGLSCIDNNKLDLNWLQFPKTYVTNGCTLCVEICKHTAFVALAGPLFNRGPSNVATGINAGAYLASTKLGLHWNDSFYDWTGGPVLPIGEWVLTAITRQSGSGGQVVAVHTVSLGTGYQTASPGSAVAVTFDELKIGTDDLLERRFFSWIANARLYNRALDKTELQELFYRPYQMLIPA